MKRTRLYICDTDPGFICAVRRAVSSFRSIEIVGSTGNGRRALEDIIRTRPDVLLTDISVPELDGIALLREVSHLTTPVSVIICTRFYSRASMELASKYGAALFLCKPVELNNLPRLIQECDPCSVKVRPSHADSGEIHDESHRRASAVRSLLLEIGLSSRLKGSLYIVEAAVNCYENSMLYKNLTRGLYSELAERMNTTVDRIERSLRSAISIAYDRGNLNLYFTERPSNKQFIEFVMRRIG